MESSFSSPRNDSFPAGLRVLVVDDDPTWLKILEKMLKKCSYEVTTCGLAREALNLLRERKDGYDIVISDVNMPDMDGFKLLEHVGLEMDLPVIMMSVDGETSRVMKGVQHGACDYLLKPIRMKELRNIWQHVFRKKIHEIRDIEGHESIEGIQLIRNGSDQYDEGYFLSAEDLSSSRKRKDADNKYDDKDFSDCSSTKKARVVWSVDLHQKFVKAVHQIGFDKVGPKKILDLMNVPWLTRENVASHLQGMFGERDQIILDNSSKSLYSEDVFHCKGIRRSRDRRKLIQSNPLEIVGLERKYRLYLSRLQKENDLKSSFGGTKHSDYYSKDPQGILSLQNSISIQQNDVAHGSYKFPGNRLVDQSVDPKSNEGDIKGIISEPVAEPKKGSTGNIPDSQKMRSSQMDFSSSYAETKKRLVGNVLDSEKIRSSQIDFNSYAETKKHSVSSVPDSEKIGSSKLDFNSSYAETKNRLVGNVPDSVKLRSSQMRLSHSFPSVESEVNLTASDSTIPTAYSWNEIQLKKEPKPLLPLNNGFSKPPLPGPNHHFQADQPQSIPSVSSRPSFAKGDATSPTKSRPLYSECRNNHGSNVSPAVNATESFPDRTKSSLVDHWVAETISTSTSNMKNPGFNLSCITDMEPAQRNLILGSASPFAALDDDFHVCWYQGECDGMNLGLQNVEFSEFNYPPLVTEVPAHLYDALRVGYEYPCDPSEYCVVDQGLFIT